jgi:hypothetical protein
MVIVKNLLSFCVEFDILLHFLLICRLWSVNKDVNVRNKVWSKMDRTYTKKSSEKHFLNRIMDRNYQNYGPQNWGMLSEIALLRKHRNCGPQFSKLRTTIIGVVSANLRFESSYSLELRGDCTPLSQISLNTLKNWSQGRKKRKNTIGEEFEEGELKNRVRNRRSSRCILLFTLFSCCVVV